MSRSYLGRRFDQILGAIAGGSHRKDRRGRTGRVLGLEPLESRALLSTITASGVISSTPDGGAFDYTIALSNSAASTAAIGTFWFAWIPGQDYLHTSPISESPPTGWSVGQVSHGSSADGYAIQFVSDSSIYDVQPGNSLNFTFKSADTPASVEANSVFYPTTPVGTSTVYAGGPFVDPEDQFVVTVAAPTLESIAVTPVNPSVAKGQAEQFMAIGTFSNNSTENLTSQVTWASATTSAATISNALGSQGLASSVGQGTSTISATFDGITGSTVLTVNPAAVVSLAVTPANPFAVIGTTQQFTATGTFTDNTTQNVTTEVNWSSGTTSVATISNVSGSQGLASAVAKGMSTISATLDGITGSTVLSVTPALQSIAITPADPNVPKGETEAFTATGTFADNSTENLTNQVTWASANIAAATISNAPGSFGLASALATGTSTISATFEGITGSTVLTVSPAALVSISLSPANPSVIEGTTDQFTATGTYSDDSTQNLTNLVTWSSAAPSVATISSAGLASAIAPGASTISAFYQGITGSTALAVSPPLVTLMTVAPTIKRHKLTKVTLTFSGSLEADLEADKALYKFIIAGKKGSFAAKNAMIVKVSKATALSPETVTLTPKTAFLLTKPVELVVNGLQLKDSLGRLIDGNHDGQPGGNAIAVISKNTVTIEM